MPKPKRDIFDLESQHNETVALDGEEPDDEERQEYLQRRLRSLEYRWKDVYHTSFSECPSIIKLIDEDTEQFFIWKDKAEKLEGLNDWDGLENALKIAHYYIQVMNVMCDISKYYRYNRYRCKRGNANWSISYERPAKWVHRILREPIEEYNDGLEAELERLRKYNRICRISDRRANLDLLGVRGYSAPDACPAFKELEKLDGDSSWDDILRTEHDILAVENDHLTMMVLELVRIVERMRR